VKALIERQELREANEGSKSADLERLESIEGALYGTIDGETYLVDARAASLAIYEDAVAAAANIAHRFHDA
jgi:hypothetical protein